MLSSLHQKGEKVPKIKLKIKRRDGTQLSHSNHLSQCFVEKACALVPSFRSCSANGWKYKHTVNQMRLSLLLLLLHLVYASQTTPFHIVIHTTHITYFGACCFALLLPHTARPRNSRVVCLIVRNRLPARTQPRQADCSPEKTTVKHANRGFSY